LARRKDQLERVNEQLKLLDGPLFALNKATEITWVAFVKRYCNDPNFRTANNRIRPETQEIWRHWMKNVFMPLNVQMAQVVTEHADLLEEEGEMPDCLKVLCTHVHGYKSALAAWEEKNYSEHMSLTAYPQDLDAYVNTTYKMLKSRQAGLIAESKN
jgi:hypothetical protein